MIEFFYNFIQKKAVTFDKKWFDGNEKNQKKAAKFFFVTAKITRFLLFSKSGTLLITLFLGLRFYWSSLYFRAGVAVFADFGIAEGFKFLVLNLPFPLILLLFYSIFILDLTLLNTFLVSCLSVNQKIKSLYGDNFLKLHFYNSGIASAKAAGQTSKVIAAGVLGSVVGGTISNVVGEFLYSKNYNTYADTLVKYPELHGVLEPPKKGIFGFKLGK